MKKAFSLTEITIVIAIMGFIAILVVKASLRNSQSTFAIKYDKIEETLDANITRGLIRRTGFNYDDYNSNNTAYVSDITANLNGNQCNNCYNNNKIGETNISSYNKFLMENGAVLIIQNNGLDVFVDVNGEKGPNELDKDIYKYKYGQLVARNRQENQVDNIPEQEPTPEENPIVDPTPTPNPEPKPEPTTDPTPTKVNCTGTAEVAQGNKCVCNTSKMIKTPLGIYSMLCYNFKSSSTVYYYKASNKRKALQTIATAQNVCYKHVYNDCIRSCPKYNCSQYAKDTIKK